MVKKGFLLLNLLISVFFVYGISIADYNPTALETITADDDSTWERVTDPGFGNINNISVVAMAEYGGRIYAMTRNDVQGAEVWRTNSSGGWEQVLFPGGVTNGIYGNKLLNNVWARIIVFNSKLYFGFSSGLQGSYLYSTGAEVWRYDGTTWEPVISDKKDVDEAGSITTISDCARNDTARTGQITDSSKTWVTDIWAGGVLEITSGSGKFRRFNIISNTANTLTFQQNEVAGNGADWTNCSEVTFSNPYPVYSYTVGAIQVGDTFEIGMGADENGFGDFWNKTITDMTTFDGKLYVSTGLNYENGGQVWYTTDGDTWIETQPAHSFGNYHPNTTGYANNLKPVSSSITNLSGSAVSGSPVLYAGGTGTTGSLGGTSRMAKLTDTGWQLIVDVNVDTNATGTNENGFGDFCPDNPDPSTGVCYANHGNFMPWTLADFHNKLFAGINSFDGARVLYTETGGSEDGNWSYSVGGTSSVPDGFDDVINPGFTADTSTHQNLAANLFVFTPGDTLYAGTVTLFVPEMGATKDYLTGAEIWKSPDGLSWEQVTGNGFGDNQTVIFEAFTVFGNTLYVSGSKGASSTPQSLGGAKIYRLVQPETLVTLRSFETKPMNKKVMLTWATDSEIDNAGFNIYRAESENGEYVKINDSLISAEGSPTESASYEFVDSGLKNRTTYYYKLEDIDLSGASTMHGPVQATPRLFYIF